MRTPRQGRRRSVRRRRFTTRRWHSPRPSGAADEVTEPNPRTLAYVAERKADLADIAGCESMEHDRWSQAQQVSQRLTTQAGMQAAPTATPPAAGSRTSTLVARVLFGTGKSALTPGAQAQLNEFVSAMHDEPDTKAVITGHADSTGSADRNERLSEMRADAVKTFLVGHGVSPDRIETKGFGEAEPAASNDTTQGRANNRRVDVMLEIKTLPQTH